MDSRPGAARSSYSAEADGAAPGDERRTAPALPPPLARERPPWQSAWGSRRRAAPEIHARGRTFGADLLILNPVFLSKRRAGQGRSRSCSPAATARRRTVHAECSPLGCCSAREVDADQDANLLNPFYYEGSISRAERHSAQWAGLALATPGDPRLRPFPAALRPGRTRVGRKGAGPGSSPITVNRCRIRDSIWPSESRSCASQNE